MPLINVFTSAELPSSERVDALLLSLSKRLAARLGKPESYVMTSLTPRARMTFAGSTAPACYAELKSISKMTPELTEALSAELCAALSEGLGVPPNRIYLEFAGAEPHLWGHDGSTFA